jgi:hypothetical protein
MRVVTGREADSSLRSGDNVLACTCTNVFNQRLAIEQGLVLHAKTIACLVEQIDKFLAMKIDEIQILINGKS